MDRSISQTVRRWIYPSISFHIILGLAQLFFSFCEIARVVTDIGKIYSGRMRGRTTTFLSLLRQSSNPEDDGGC